MVRSSPSCGQPGIARLFSLITVWATELAIADSGTLRSYAAAWYQKKDPTFSDAVAAVRRVLWSPPDFSMSRTMADTVIMPVRLLKRFVDTLSSQLEMRKVELSGRTYQTPGEELLAPQRRGQGRVSPRTDTPIRQADRSPARRDKRRGQRAEFE